MGPRLNLILALVAVSAVSLPGLGRSEGRAVLAGPPVRQLECSAALAAVERVLELRKGRRLAYALDLPTAKVPEGSWTRRMSLPLLGEFDAKPHASAISGCPDLRESLERRGAVLVEGNATDEQRGADKDDRIAVLRVTLPILSANRKGAMVRVEIRCGHACGGGNTYYLVLQDTGWTYTALRAEWMASDEVRVSRQTETASD